MTHGHESEIAAEMRKLNEAQQAAYRIAWYQEAFFKAFDTWLRQNGLDLAAAHADGTIDGVLVVCHATAIKVVANMRPEMSDD